MKDRRTFVKYAASVLGAGLLTGTAGCVTGRRTTIETDQTVAECGETTTETGKTMAETRQPDLSPRRLGILWRQQ